MVEAGEASGTLDKSLERLANQREKDADIISKVRGALVYPLCSYRRHDCRRDLYACGRFAPCPGGLQGYSWRDTAVCDCIFTSSYHAIY